ncbi:hypothetical protein CPB83DRAFT_910478 [Crepidotus variabilis]|uniref:Uncharacterized protein n=1 Tax=Crepidotus variabilis TaxID=179855 RepID=A0A9P6JJW8_9AGAR|nr:hypothetical protein CPB83DRAFT_910478 [Crepidotus variabilis]
MHLVKIIAVVTIFWGLVSSLALPASPDQELLPRARTSSNRGRSKSPALATHRLAANLLHQAQADSTNPLHQVQVEGVANQQVLALKFQ